MLYNIEAKLTTHFWRSYSRSDFHPERHFLHSKLYDVFDRPEDLLVRFDGFDQGPDDIRFLYGKGPPTDTDLFEVESVHPISDKKLSKISSVGQRYRFRLALSLDIRRDGREHAFKKDMRIRRDKDNKNFPFDSYPDDQQAAIIWLNAKNTGFQVEADTVQVPVDRPIHLPCHRIQYIPYMDVSGILTVDDAKLFKRSIQRGVGRKKRFGCGLLDI